MPIHLRTYLTDGRVDIEAASGPLDDPDYTEGYIDFTIDDVALMGRDLSDSIAMLWSSMVDGFEAVSRGETEQFSFPDQPIPVAFQPIGGGRVLVQVTVDDEKRSAQAERSAFLAAGLAAARVFFTAWKGLAPDDAAYAEAHLERIAAIEGPSA